MQYERESLQPLNVVDYNIAGNDLQAFLDTDGKLVCVLDNMISDVKPNVLLVINPVGDRKWDDILANDYGVDLELVRPKKDNKYQKLDVEYSGLAQYDALIRAYNENADLSEVLDDLNAFRNQAAINAATERLALANAIIERTQETIEKTEDAINQIQEKIKSKRAVLADLRKNIGREPTKQSAAKILKTESVIDAATEKLGRAKKRLRNAQNRLDSATGDADVAQGILDKLGNVVVRTETIDKVENMPEDKNDDVKPLFEKDPEILDDEIAFKPIDFGNGPMVEPEKSVAVLPEPQMPAVQHEPQMPAVQHEPQMPAVTEEKEDVLIQPLMFTPPVSYSEEPGVMEEISEEENYESEPLLNTISPFVQPEPEIVSDDVFEDMATKENVLAPIEVKPVLAEETTKEVEYNYEEPVVAPVETSEMIRPESPVVADVPVEPVIADSKSAKPTMMYYILLGVLIVLSIFTLWMYQNSANDTLPELGANIQVVEEPVVETETESLFFDDLPVTESVAETVEIEEPVVTAPEILIDEPVVEPEPVVEVEDVVEPEPVAEPEPVVEVEEDVVESEPVVVPEPVIQEPVQIIPTEEDVLASKPAYGVSQQEKMFVAAPEYETEVVETETIETCSDGNAPDADGCCAGESLSQLPNGQLACCSEATGECFPPMF